MKDCNGLVMSDYPAAHSMDTTWFAVDEDGAIALFDTGPEGALPLALRDRCENGPLSFALLEGVLARDEAGFFLLNGDPAEVRGLASPALVVALQEEALRYEADLAAARELNVVDGLYRDDERAWLNTHGALGDVYEDQDFFENRFSWQSPLVVVVRAATDAAQIGCVEGARFREAPEVLLVLRYERQVLARACAEGAVVAVAEASAENPELVAALGFYVYGTGFQMGSPPFTREWVPSAPSDALPGAASERAPRLPVRFARDARIQPAEFVASMGWGPTYERVDGSVARFPEPPVPSADVLVDEGTEDVRSGCSTPSALAVPGCEATRAKRFSSHGASALHPNATLALAVPLLPSPRPINRVEVPVLRRLARRPLQVARRSRPAAAHEPRGDVCLRDRVSECLPDGRGAAC